MKMTEMDEVQTAGNTAGKDPDQPVNSDRAAASLDPGIHPVFAEESQLAAALQASEVQKPSIPSKPVYLYRIFYAGKYFWRISTSASPKRVLSAILGQARKDPDLPFSQFILYGGCFKEAARIEEVTCLEAADEGKLPDCLIEDIKQVCANIRRQKLKQGIEPHRISDLYTYFLKDQSLPKRERFDKLKAQMLNLARWIDFDLPQPGYLALILELQYFIKPGENTEDENPDREELYGHHLPAIAEMVYLQDFEFMDRLWKNGKPSIRRQKLFVDDFLSQELWISQKGEAAWFYPEFSLKKPLISWPEAQRAAAYSEQLSAFLDWKGIRKLNMLFLPETEALENRDLAIHQVPQTLTELHPETVVDVSKPVAEALKLHQNMDAEDQEIRKQIQSLLEGINRRMDCPLLVIDETDQDSERFTRFRIALKRLGFSNVYFFVFDGQKSKPLAPAQDGEEGFSYTRIFERLPDQDEKESGAPWKAWIAALDHVLGFELKAKDSYLPYENELLDDLKSRKAHGYLWLPQEDASELAALENNPKLQWLKDLPVLSSQQQLEQAVSDLESQGISPHQIIGIARDEADVLAYGKAQIPAVFADWGNRYQNVPTRALKTFHSPCDLHRALAAADQQAGEKEGTISEPSSS